MAILTSQARRSVAVASGERAPLPTVWSRATRAWAGGEVRLCTSGRTEPLRGSLRVVPQNSQVAAVASDSGAPQCGQWAEERARSARVVADVARERTRSERVRTSGPVFSGVAFGRAT